MNFIQQQAFSVARSWGEKVPCNCCDPLWCKINIGEMSYEQLRQLFNLFPEAKILVEDEGLLKAYSPFQLQLSITPIIYATSSSLDNPEFDPEYEGEEG